jgi:putative ABC transport system permease protein
MIKLALRLFWREWRSSELRILVAALIIAVAALSTIGMYTSRISQALENQAAELLGGDAQITSSTPYPADWQQYAQKTGINSASQILFSSMIVAGEQLQLANIKAVSSHYPLRGHIRTTTGVGTTEQIEKNIPVPGTIWVDARLLTLLNIPLNATVKIGHATFIVQKILSYEPDAQPYNLNIAPRVIMNETDLPATQMIQPGSRVEYRWLMTGTPTALQHFSSWITSKLSEGQKLRDASQGLTELKSTLQKANSYLHLAAIACVILAGIAIATAARRYSQRHYDISALLRCFGVTQRKILQIYLSYLLSLGMLASLMGIFIGYITQYGFAAIFSSWMAMTLPPPALSSVFFSLTIGLIILFGFALPPILILKNIPPIRVLRREGLVIPDNSVLTYVFAGLVIVGLLLWYTANPQLTALFLFSILFTGSILYTAALGLIKLSTRLRSYNFNGHSSAFKYGLANLARRSNSSAIQLVAFGLVIMTVLLLTLIRSNLLNTWQQQLPKNAPNYFAINIQPNEVNAVSQLLTQQQIKTAGIYPMVRGRLTELNNQPIMQAVPASARTNNALNRELNLTWTDIVPSDNRILEGKWWTENDKNKPILSIETKLAKDLGIVMGDELTFQIGDKKIQARVQSIRSLEWDNFHPNFYIIFPSGILDNMQSTYITSFYIDPNKKHALTTLIQQFPNVTLIDIAMILTQARELTSKMALAIELILGFTLAAGLAVLYAALQTSRDERLLEGAILRTLGANSRFLKISLATEFMTLGLLAGLLGATGASLVGFALATQVFDMPYSWSLWPWLVGILSGTLLIGLFGLYGTRNVIKQSPLIVLQEI